MPVVTSPPELGGCRTLARQGQVQVLEDEPAEQLGPACLKARGG